MATPVEYLNMILEQAQYLESCNKAVIEAEQQATEHIGHLYHGVTLNLANRARENRDTNRVGLLEMAKGFVSMLEAPTQT